MAGLPDYMTDPNAVLKDADVQWRHGQPPDYSKTRKVFEQTTDPDQGIPKTDIYTAKQTSHEPGSLPDLVQNLVKNWEIEASFKTNLRDWRTVDPEVYTFAVNGGSPQPAEHMLKVGTYNAIIGTPNAWYSPRRSDLASSHKTFKRMMPTFAWEVLEVYGGPPNGEKITAKAHGGPIDIQGVTVAHLNDKSQVTKLETWFDPIEMFRQIAPEGSALSKQSPAALAGAAAGCPAMAGGHGVSSDGVAQGAGGGGNEAIVVLKAESGQQP
ncbi:hypothetical protein PG999_009318 [Apiospora kogelbergensis]|uniref:SnoaL-like polyketide cyclase n=1 Tax=Apiospora kogelbergensis TaxID=1337665 RepID=A0AAW0QQX1_9PEZI